MEIFFIVFGVLLLLVLLGWSLWSARREKSRVFRNKFDSRISSQETERSEPKPFPEPNSPSPLNTMSSSEISAQAEREMEAIQVSIAGMGAEPPVQEENVAQAEIEPHEIKVSFADEVISSQSVQSDAQSHSQSESPNVSQAAPQAQESAQQAVTSMLLLYIMASQHQRVFQGQALLQQFEDHGLLFGENGFFNRHLDNTNTSPIIYSVANIYEPGVFDPVLLAQSQPEGVLLIMPLPSVGSAKVNLSNFINDAHSIAQQLQGFVLDDQFKQFDQESHARYLNAL